MADFTGTPGNDTLTGTSGNDKFDMSQGGDDIVQGLAGRDLFIYGAAFNANDQVNGGAGNDVLRLTGDYSAGVVFNANTIQSIETLQLDGGHSYNLTLTEGNVAAGTTMIVTANTLGAGDVLTFNGAGVTSGGFSITAGAGNDFLTGGQAASTFILTAGGNDTATGGAGDDSFVMGAAFTGHDRIDGGAGDDTVTLDGDYAANITFAGYTMKNVETLALAAGHSYNLTPNESTVAKNAMMTVDGSALSAGDTLTFNAGAETNGHYHIIGGAGNDVITGSGTSSGDGSDLIDLSEGGHDTFNAVGASGVTVYMGAALDPLDKIGSSNQNVSMVVELNGDYSGANALTLSPTTLNHAGLQLDGGHDYDIDTGAQTIQANSLSQEGDTVRVDESGSTAQNGFVGGHGSDTFIGGSAKDFFTDTGGSETFVGNGGNDIFNMGGFFDSSDQIDGGAGSDTVNITGVQTGSVVMGATTMVNVEDLVITGGFDAFSITSNDATVAAGQTLTVDGRAATSGFTFDGSAETDGHFVFLNESGGGERVNTFLGGALSDTFDIGHKTTTVATGGGGADSFIVGAVGTHNFDTLNYNAVSDSTSTAYDTVTGWNFTGDIFHVSPVTTVTGVDAAVTTGSLSTATFDSDLASDVGAGQLAADHAVLFTASAGTLSGHTFLIVDANGVAGYQAGADLVIDVTGATGTLSTSSFN